MRSLLQLHLSLLLALSPLLACQCNAPASKDLNWNAPPCLDPVPPCPYTLLCKGGKWDCFPCVEGEQKSCYSGPAHTEGKGTCKAGTQTCEFGVWTACQGEILPTQKERCGDHKDDDCDGQIDEDCECDPSKPPRSCGRDTGECKSGFQRCGSNGKWMACEDAILPKGERCNSLDDDCDGAVDEDFAPNTLQGRGLGMPCETGKGTCKRTGIYICSPDQLTTVCNAKAATPTPEICDNQDNDCDGQIDEDLQKNCRTSCGNGTQTCQAGRWKTCNAPTPTPELCDDKDNDCNGKIDEKWPKKDKPCVAGKGQCKQIGKWICKPDHSGLTCDATPLPPSQQETCDGLDNDCNGKIDDNFVGKDSPCNTGKPTPCETGTQQCLHGKPTCVMTPSSTPEDCDGLDNDCNGKIDDNIPPKPCINSCRKTSQKTCDLTTHTWTACSDLGCCQNGTKQSCYNGPTNTAGVGICKAGKQTCQGGKWGPCKGEILPKPQEDCTNDEDDNCNGQKNEGCP